ncbi:MAG: arsenate reductase ArsC [Deltaproteobacteria bacterium]|nr:arsenate reductase ArsC [Deltaproteobacteria bacterium]
MSGVGSGVLPARGLLFVCMHNSARSPMAEALARKRFPELPISSAGLVPSETVHPLAVETLRDEDSLDIRAHRPRHLGSVDLAQVDLVVSLAGPEVLASLPRGLERLHWATEDPTLVSFDVRRDVLLDRFRDVRDSLVRRLEQLRTRGHESFGPPGLR